MPAHAQRAFESLVEQIFRGVDTRVISTLRADYARRLPVEPHGQLPSGQHIVLVGHRAAGKSRLLPLIARLVSRRAHDLDREIERRAGRPIRDWLPVDAAGFRAFERETFLTLPPEQLVSVGGGFLQHHGEVLKDHVPVLIPVSFETYRERLLADSSRPRLRPDLSPEDEIREVFDLREGIHARHPLWSLVDLVLACRPSS